MLTIGIESTTTAVPVLRYRDVPAAIEWLCRTLGFVKQLVVNNEAGSIRLAQLTFGNGVIMLAPVQETELDKLMVQPDEVGGAETQIAYFYVADTAAHYAHAKAAGAQFVLDNDETNQLKRGYSCRDPEGHIWSFGTYNPVRPATRQSGFSGRTLVRSAFKGLSACLSVVLTATVAAMCWAYAVYPPDPDAHLLNVISHPELAEQVDERLGLERIAREAAEREARAANDQLTRALKRESEEKAAKDALQRALATAHNAKAEAERASAQATSRLARQQGEREAADRAAEDARRQLGLEQSARSAAEAAAAEARGQLAHKRAVQRAARAGARVARERSVMKAAEKPAPINLFNVH